MTRCLFGWNAFSAVKTIIYNHVWINCLPRLCIFHLFEQPKCSLTHEKLLQLLTNMSSKISPFSCTPFDFFFFFFCLQISAFSNNKASSATCLIVIDAFDCVKFRHLQPDSHKLKAAGLHHVGRNPKNSTHCCFCCVSKQTEEKPNKAFIETAPKTKCCCCCSFVGIVWDWWGEAL